jgi:dihydroflavonol-4-reductase
MTTLVTGGTGFLGRHLVRELLRRGESNIRVLTRSFDMELSDLGVELFEGSLLDAENVRDVVRGVEKVYHLAGRVERDPMHAHKMYELHVDGTRRLLDALRKTDVSKIVVASTSGTVGVGTHEDFIAHDGCPTVENTVREWPYYLSKIYAERVCAHYRSEHDLPIVIMRPTLLLGPGDQRESSTGDVILFMRRRLAAIPPGGISFVDVRDAAQGFVSAMENGKVGHSYLLGACNLTIAAFFTRLEDITGIRGPRLPLPHPAAVAGAKVFDSVLKMVGKRADVDPTSVEMAKYYWYIDSTGARRDLDWTTRAPNQTLRDTVEWIQSNHPAWSNANDRRQRPPEEFVSQEVFDFAESLRTNGDMRA